MARELGNNCQVLVGEPWWSGNLWAVVMLAVGGMCLI